MINGKKNFMTRVYMSTIPNELKCKIGSMLCELKEKSKINKFEEDYLQVFKLSEKVLDGVRLQRVEHFQEVPLYSNIKEFKLDNPIFEKVYVITDKVNSESVVTFLLASEY